MFFVDIATMDTNEPSKEQEEEKNYHYDENHDKEGWGWGAMASFFGTAVTTTSLSVLYTTKGAVFYYKCKQIVSFTAYVNWLA